MAQISHGTVVSFWIRLGEFDDQKSFGSFISLGDISLLPVFSYVELSLVQLITHARFLPTAMISTKAVNYFERHAVSLRAKHLLPCLRLSITLTILPVWALVRSGIERPFWEQNKIFISTDTIPPRILPPFLLPRAGFATDNLTVYCK